MRNVTNTLRKYVAIVLLAVIALGLAPTVQAADQSSLLVSECPHAPDRDPKTCPECIALRDATAKSQQAAAPLAQKTESANTLEVQQPTATVTATATATAKATATADSDRPTPLTKTEATAETKADPDPTEIPAGDTKDTDPAKNPDQEPPKLPDDKTPPDDKPAPGPGVQPGPGTPPEPGDEPPPPPSGEEGEGPAVPGREHPWSKEGDENAEGKLPIDVTGVTASPDALKVGETSTLTATLSGVGAEHAPQGQIVFRIGDETQRAQVTGSSATATWTPKQEGTLQVTAKYAPGGEEDRYAAGAQSGTSVTATAVTVPSTLEGLAELLTPMLTRSGAATGDLKDATVSVTGEYAYTGSEIVPTYTVELNGTILQNGTDYTQTLSSNIETGTATLTVTGAGSYTGQNSATFMITPASASDWVVTPTTLTTNGTSEIDLASAGISIVDANSNAISLSEVDITQTGDWSGEGTAEATFTPKSSLANYTGSDTQTFALALAPLASIDITQALVTWDMSGSFLNGTSRCYLQPTGANTIEPKATVSVNGQTLIAGTDYNITYTNTSALGSATATVVGAGSYIGSASNTYTYTIVAASQNLTVTLNPATYVYTGRAITPRGNAVVVTNSTTGARVASSLYDLSYADNTDVGTATVVVTPRNGSGYTGQATATFTITPRATSMTLTSNSVGGILWLTATVIGSADPQGTVDFTVTANGNQYTYSQTVTNGRATVQVPILASGYSVTAVFTPSDGNNTTATASLNPFTVPTVKITVNESGINGDYASVLVTVSAGRGTQPTGYVILRLDGREIARLRLDRYGQASYTLYGQAWGRQMISAEYLGDGYYAGATSDSVPIWDYSKKIATIKLDTSGTNPATLTATVGGYMWYERPTGYVTFYNGEKLLGTIQLDRRGEAVYTWRNVPTGTSTVYAVYSGDTQYRSITATAKITRRASSGSGTSTEPIATAAPTLNAANVLLRDANGNLLSTYDTTRLSLETGNVLTIESSQALDFYSYGFALSKLSELSGSYTGGYFNLVTPGFNVHLPFAMQSGLENLNAYLQQQNLTASETELRLIVRSVTDSSLTSAFETAHSGATPTAMYRVEIALYAADGRKLDYTPAQITAPLQLLVPIPGQTGIAEGYDETTRSFFAVAVDFGDGVAMLTIAKNGIYIVGQQTQAQTQQQQQQQDQQQQQQDQGQGGQGQG